MNYRIFAAALLATASALSVAYSQTGFQDVLDTPALKSPLASKTLFNGIALAGKRLVGVGQRGHIVYSDDEGNNWNQAAVPVSSDLTAVAFPSPNLGWAVGHDGVVLHSSDGGATWSKQFDDRAEGEGKGPDKPFLDVWFENETTGFIVGAFNLIFRTVDGGKNWEPWFDRMENEKRLHLYAIRPVGKDLFIAGEQGLVLKLDAHSGRFRALKVPYNGTFFGLTGKPGAVIAHGMRGNVFRSTDGGGSWQKIESGMPLGLTGSTVTTDGRIVLLSQAGHMLTSRDDGASFTPVRLEQPFPASALVALDKENLILAGLRGMMKQTLKQ